MQHSQRPRARGDGTAAHASCPRYVQKLYITSSFVHSIHTFFQERAHSTTDSHPHLSHNICSFIPYSYCTFFRALPETCDTLHISSCRDIVQPHPSGAHSAGTWELQERIPHLISANGPSFFESQTTAIIPSGSTGGYGARLPTCSGFSKVKRHPTT
jgi:hypothetical protein